MNNNTSLGTASLVLGICSLLAGWIFIAPIIGLVLGFKSRREEPLARTRANWGIVLNGFCMLGWVMLLVILAVAGYLSTLQF